MMTDLQMETMTAETASLFPVAEEAFDSAAIVQLGEDELDLCSGGARNAGSSSSGFNRKRMGMSEGTFAGPDGAGSFRELKTEETSSFSNDNFFVDQ
jgi:hypothetical protein